MKHLKYFLVGSLVIVIISFIITLLTYIITGEIAVIGLMVLGALLCAYVIGYYISEGEAY